MEDNAIIKSFNTKEDRDKFYNELINKNNNIINSKNDKALEDLKINEENYIKDKPNKKLIRDYDGDIHLKGMYEYIIYEDIITYEGDDKEGLEDFKIEEEEPQIFYIRYNEVKHEYNINRNYILKDININNDKSINNNIINNTSNNTKKRKRKLKYILEDKLENFTMLLFVYIAPILLMISSTLFLFMQLNIYEYFGDFVQLREYFMLDPKFNGYVSPINFSISLIDITNLKNIISNDFVIYFFLVSFGLNVISLIYYLYQYKEYYTEINMFYYIYAGAVAIKIFGIGFIDITSKMWYITFLNFPFINIFATLLMYGFIALFGILDIAFVVITIIRIVLLFLDKDF